MLGVEVEEIGKAVVGAMAIGAAGSCGSFGATGSLDLVVVSGWSNVNLEKSWEVDGTVTGSGLNEDAGMANSIRSRCWLSLMEMTIFSRSTGVMCFSRARFLLSVERWRVSSGRVDGAQEASSSSSDTAESRLEDSSGTGMSPVAARGLYEAGGVRRRRGLGSGCAQQKVSRFQRRQLRFSSRLPSSIAWEVLEKSDHCGRRKESGMRVERRKFPAARVGTTYHAKEVLDAAGVDCVQGRHFDA